MVQSATFPSTNTHLDTCTKKVGLLTNGSIHPPTNCPGDKSLSSFALFYGVEYSWIAPDTAAAALFFFFISFFHIWTAFWLNSANWETASDVANGTLRLGLEQGCSGCGGEQEEEKWGLRCVLAAKRTRWARMASLSLSLTEPSHAQSIIRSYIWIGSSSRMWATPNWHSNH